MLKKLYLVSLFIAGSIYADNFYLGGGVGLSSLTAKEKTTTPDTYSIKSRSFDGTLSLLYNF